MRKILACALLASAVMAASAPATAAEFIQLNNGPVDNKIKAFSDATHPSDGLSVYGQTTVGGELVKFTGNTKLNITDGAGYAQISDFDAGDGAWNNLTIAFDSYAYGFTGLEFSIMFENQGGNKGALELEAFFLDGSDSQKFSFANINGNTGFYLSADFGEVFSHVVLNSGKSPFFQFKQADIAIAAAPPPAVPEPATWAMMIGGLGLVGAVMRRRSAAVRFA